MHEQFDEEQAMAVYKAVYAFAMSLTKNNVVADDITQETFEAVLKDKNKYRGDSSLYGYLCGIAKHKWFDYLKKHHKELANETVAETVAKNELNVETQIENKMMVEEIMQYVNDMPEPYREVFCLHIFGDLSFVKISKMYGKSDSWGRVTYARAVNMIREQVKGW